MKKLMAVSSFKTVASELPVLEKQLNGKTVTFIPTASQVETVTFYVKTAKQALMKMGLVIDEVDVSNIASEEIKYKLRNNEFIYVTGGNSFFLLQELKKSGAAQVLIDEINQGKLYIGESAGAIVLTNSIVYIERMDQP